MPLSRISSPSIQNFSVEAQDFANNSIETYTSNAGRPLSNRNLVINGAMQVAQRATSVTGITTNGYFTADRWRISLSSAGTWTSNIDSSGPANTEFRNSANVVCTTAKSSLDAGNFFLFAQRIEGQNLQSIKKGTSAAESLTVSFYVKSSNTGTYICEFFDNDNTRQISKSYTINTANTWEKKTITIPPDTTGLFDNDNAESFNLLFWLAAGTTYTSGTLNSSVWATNVQANRTVGQLNLANLSGNYWAVTGIQLETGTVATPFEMRSVGQELALCQRYYQILKRMSAYVSNTNAVNWNLIYYCPMRAIPTLGQQGVIEINDNTVNVVQTSVGIVGFDGDNEGYIGQLQNFPSTLTVNRVALFRLSANKNGITADAEL